MSGHGLQSKLDEWRVPYLDVVILERFSVLPPSFFDPQQSAANWTVEELAEKAGESPATIIKELDQMQDLAANIEISVDELARSRQENGLFPVNWVLLDVRERWEFDTAKIQESILMADQSFPELLPALRSAAAVICICHHGIRSFSAAMFLRQQGVPQARTLSGGIDAWAKKIDPKVGIY